MLDNDCCDIDVESRTAETTKFPFTIKAPRSLPRASRPLRTTPSSPQDSRAHGSLWVATNQCLGGSASCVNIAERLNRQLRQCDNQEIKPIDSAAFSIAMNGTEARLYISWKHNELDYYVRKVDSFLLQKDRDYIDFRKHMLNIIDWGKGKRLKQIRDSLDILVEENRKTASQQAKSRPPPTDDSANSKSYKRKNSRKGKTFDHSSDAIQDSQSSHYQSN